MNAICRFFADAGSRARHRSFRVGSFRFALLILAFVALPPSPAKAVSTDQAIDIVIKVAVQGGRFIGLNVPEEAALLLKELVKCGIEGGGSVPDCAKQSVVKVALNDAPKEVQEIAGCLVGKPDPLGCATKIGLSKVPPQARPMVECMLGGSNVADCAGKAALGEALAKVPPEVHPLLECLGKGGNAATCGAQAAANALPDGDAKNVAVCVAGGGKPEDCAAQFGKGVVDQAQKQATQDVINKLKELKADANQKLEQQTGQMSGTVGNIIDIAKGIQEEDWGKVVWNGGQELAKVVVTILIEVLFPPAALIAGPVIGALVDVYGGLLENLFNLVVTGDFKQLPVVLVQFYFSEMIARPCALIPESLSGFKDAVCGNLAKVIGAAAGFVGDVVDFVAGIVEGIVGGIVAGFKWFIGLFDGKEDPKFCRSPQEYFAKNYLPCLGAATGASADASPVSGASGLNAACATWFTQCYDRKEKAEPMCNALGGALTDQANQVNAALDQGARTYTPAIGAFLYARREAFCTNGRHNSIEQARSAVNDFQTQCTNAIGQNVPLPVNACAHKKTPISRSPGPSLACSRAIANSNWENLAGDTCEKWCREKKENCPPQGPSCLERGNIVVEAYGFTYVFPQMERSLCVIKPWSPWDRIWAVINPPTFKYLWPSFDDHFVNIYRDTATITNPIWSNNIPAAFNDVMVPGLSLGSCRSMRTMLTANMQWTKTPVRTRLGQAQLQVLQSPVSDASRTNVSSMFRIHPTPAVTETLALTLTPVALVSSFDSCPATATFASRGSSGTDGSFTPRNNVTRTNKGGVTANRGSSGAYPSRDPRGSSGTSSAIDRLTGDGMGGGAGSGYRLPDTARGPMPGSQPGTRGSSGASPASGQPGGSSGAGGGQPGGSSGWSTSRDPRGSSGAGGGQPGGSSGASFTPGGGATGRFGPGASSGTIRQNRPAIQQIYRPQQPSPSESYKSRVN